MHQHRRAAVVLRSAQRRRPERDHLRHVPVPVSHMAFEDRSEDGGVAYLGVESVDQFGDFGLGAELGGQHSVSRWRVAAALSGLRYRARMSRNARLIRYKLPTSYRRARRL